MTKLFCGIFFVNLVWSAISSSVIPWPPKKIFINQHRDHFSLDSGNFTELTLYEDKYWNQKGPILFYCGHEKPITKFWNNTGFIFEYANDIGGFVIFAEHRYYGDSMPFGDFSFDGDNLQYLLIAQVLKDYVKVLTDYHTRFNISVQVPVIAFGGGYGGILAGLMRLNFPNFVEGALVSSAPYRWLAGKGHLYDMFASITKVYDEINPACSEIIKKAYSRISRSNSSSLQVYAKRIKTCQDLVAPSDAFRLIEWSRSAFIVMAMMNYPYSSNFLHKLPPAPLNVSCERLSKYNKSQEMEALRDVVDFFYNSTGKLECFHLFKDYKPCADIKGCGDGTRNAAFDYQSCTEMPLSDSFQYTNGSMFPEVPFWFFKDLTSSFEGLTAHCLRSYKIQPKPLTFLHNYSDGDFSEASNIIFSNGYLDPWRLGGIFQNVSSTVVAFNIFGGAHHYDLRESNSNDSSSVVDVRRRERLVMGEWIKNFHPKT